jgi:hypothetical protein
MRQIPPALRGIRMWGCIGRKSPSVAEQPSASPDGPRVVSIKQGERLALSVGISNRMVWGERAKC